MLLVSDNTFCFPFGDSCCSWFLFCDLCLGKAFISTWEPIELLWNQLVQEFGNLDVAKKFLWVFAMGNWGENRRKENLNSFLQNRKHSNHSQKHLAVWQLTVGHTKNNKIAHWRGEKRSSKDLCPQRGEKHNNPIIWVVRGKKGPKKERGGGKGEFFCSNLCSCNGVKWYASSLENRKLSLASSSDVSIQASKVREKRNKQFWGQL